MSNLFCKSHSYTGPVIETSSLTAAADWIIQNGYWLMFIAMCLEGPFVTIAAGFALSLGHFNPLSVFLVSVAGDLIPDAMLYTAGYFGRVKFVERFGHRIGLTAERISRLEKLLHKSDWQAMLIAKFSPVVSVFALLMLGALKIPFRRYAMIASAITLSKSSVLLIVGYEFGSLFDLARAKVDTPLAAIIITLLLIVAFVGYRYGMKRISSSLER